MSAEAWKWYHKNAGGGKCAIVDTYWQVGECTSMNDSKLNHW